MISCIVADTLLLAHTLCGVLGILRTRHVRGLSPMAVSGCQTEAVVVRNGLSSDGSRGQTVADWVSSEVSEPSVFLSAASPFFFATMVVALFSVASRLRVAGVSVPVARARSFTPLMCCVVLNSSSVSAPFLFLMPIEKMARSGSFTFLPCSRISLIHPIMSVSIPLMAPAENGVL